LNITEATAVNTLLDYLLGQRRYDLGNPPTSAQAMKAAEFLAIRAHKALSAGWLPRDVLPAWEAAKPPRAERAPEFPEARVLPAQD
jgi:hypothetical protein